MRTTGESNGPQTLTQLTSQWKYLSGFGMQNIGSHTYQNENKDIIHQSPLS